MCSTKLTTLSACLILAAAPVLAAQDGRIDGHVTGQDGRPLRGVTVVVNELGLSQLTGAEGEFVFSPVPPGTYSLAFLLGDHAATREAVTVVAGQSSSIEQALDWDVGFADTSLVTAASRHPERIIDAPAAVSVLSAADIQLNASHGQLPKLLEFTPGVEVTQSGIYDYNFNTRGFNSSLNRRVAVVIDGRDPSVPLLGSQEWASVAYPLDDLSTVQFVRGPGAALYGANASSGVLDIVTTQPRFAPGGSARLTAGELGTLNGDLRWAGSVGDDWYVKALGSFRTHDDFTVSRNAGVEYSRACGRGESGDCLPTELVALARTDRDILNGSLRLDRYLHGGTVLSLEGGYADVAGPVFQTGIGRVQTLDVKRPWARVNVANDRWNVSAFYNRRKGTEQRALSSGANLYSIGESLHFEGQTNWDFADDRAHLVLGASFRHLSVDSLDPATGRQSLLFEPVSSDHGAGYAQIEYDLSERVSAVVAGRVDASNLHDTRVSPRAALLYRVSPRQTVRFTYSEAFQVANYSEFFLQAAVAPPADLSPFEAACAQFGVSCGFNNPTPVLALGNGDLEVERTKTFEIGYRGFVSDRFELSADYYRSDNTNFITDLLPQLGTPLGRVNPAFGPWQGPAGLPAPVVASIRSRVPLLSNNFDGSNILAAVSYTNFGDVDTQGIDLGARYFGNKWSAWLNYSWFDFEIKDGAPGLANVLVPNAPENRWGGGFAYYGEGWDASLGIRGVDSFRWSTGPFQGDVESYVTADLAGNADLGRGAALGVSVSNVFDNAHWESFGGDLLGRRALAYVAYSWSGR